MIVNNEVVGETEPVNLSWPNFELSFNYKFSLYVYNKPSIARLVIYRKGVFDKLIDEVKLDIPGEATSTVNAS